MYVHVYRNYNCLRMKFVDAHNPCFVFNMLCSCQILFFLPNGHNFCTFSLKIKLMNIYS